MTRTVVLLLLLSGWLVWGGAPDGEQKLSETLLAIVEHYKQRDPVGVPGAPIPDPLPIPPMNHSFSVGKMNFRDMQLYGLKKFRIEHVTLDVAALRLQAALLIDVMDVLGNYTLKTWFSSAQGPFTVKLSGVFVQATATLEVLNDGRLEAQDIAMDVTFKDMALDFQGLGFFASMFQGVMNSVGAFVFDSIKPFVLSEANANIRREVNKQAARMPQRFPNSIAPCDQVVAQARSMVRARGYDPYRVKALNTSLGLADVQLTHTWLYGAASFHRTRALVVAMRNNTLHALIEVGTQRLLGTTHWEVALVSGVLSRAGTASFSVEYLRVQVNASQSMDTRQRPRLDDLQLQLGNVQLRFDGLGTVDYVLELAVNVLPNLLRYQIMDAIERPLRRKIQAELDKVDVERLIQENAPKLDDPDGLTELTNLL
uniref:Hemolymph juvenile hormone binding protein n=1 Tax=Dendroctonus ponderosae TaxID=77166 RepID=J3JXI0_DENPD|nr:unknown [Dendroctonus ponderosae]